MDVIPGSIFHDFYSLFPCTFLRESVGPPFLPAGHFGSGQSDKRLYYPTSSGLSECVSERTTERCERRSMRTNECSTSVLVLGYSKQSVQGFVSVENLQGCVRIRENSYFQFFSLHPGRIHWGLEFTCVCAKRITLHCPD